jgi:MoaA/NifB/PqqE/SkfB family radical SAM enzyme
MILNDKLPYKRDFVGRSYEDENFSIDANVLTSAFEGKSFEIDHVSFLTFCLDRTCNLTCPSCRTELIMVKGTERDALYKMTEDTVLPMVKGAKRIMVNPAGEVFVSRPSRRLLEALSQPGYENVVVDIITNGTVCTEEEWRKFQHLFGRINFIRVSVDAASKAVFEKLRRGAKYETLLSNLHTISDMHKRGYCKNFLLSFTYQRDNVEEMEAFVEFGRSLGVSTVIFERLQNVGAFTSDDYLDRAVHLIDHPLHGAFLKAVHAVKGDPKVYIDFS